MPDPEATPSAPLLLALETTTPRTSVALLRGRALLRERFAPESPAAEVLLPAIDALLGEAELKLAAIEAFAVSIGPGSFTGLRIGVATVKGLAFGTSRPVVAVPTLAALALAAAPGEGPVLATLDARRGELYAAGYRDPQDARPDVLAEGLYPLDAFVAGLPRPCRIVGDAWAMGGELIRARHGEAVRQDPAPGPTAGYVGRLGARLLARGASEAAADLAPRYVRRAEAEARRTGQPTELAKPIGS